MIETEQNYYEVVNASLTGRRQVDEQTFASLDVLAERLELVRKLGPAFAKISLSSAARMLQRRNSLAAAV